MEEKNTETTAMG